LIFCALQHIAGARAVERRKNATPTVLVALRRDGKMDEKPMLGNFEDAQKISKTNIETATKAFGAMS
jgi:hypothetical protein